MIKKRWLMYAINGQGLGHLTRLLALARQMRRLSPQDEFLFLTSCEASLLAWQEHFASVKLSSLHSPSHAGLSRGTQLKLTRTLVPQIIAQYQPDTLVVDTFPIGDQRELLSILDWPLHRILIFREQQRTQAEMASLMPLLKRYHRIIVPHEPGVVDLRGTSSEPLHVGHMLLRGREEGLERGEARRRLGLPADGLLMFVGFGGGGESEYVSATQWALSAAAARPDVHFACVRAPLLRDALPEPDAANVSYFSTLSLSAYWAAFDGAISAAGYNSFGELLHNGVPTIWVPFKKPSEDQALRAGRAVQMGAGWLVDLYDTTRLCSALEDWTNPSKRLSVSGEAKTMVPNNGAIKAASAIVNDPDLATH